MPLIYPFELSRGASYSQWYAATVFQRAFGAFVHPAFSKSGRERVRVLIVYWESVMMLRLIVCDAVCSATDVVANSPICWIIYFLGPGSLYCGVVFGKPDASPAFRVPSPIPQARSVRVYRDALLGVAVVSLMECWLSEGCVIHANSETVC